MDDKNLKQILESLLFVAGEPIKITRLAKICGLPKNTVQQALGELAEDLKKDRGLRLIELSDTYQLVTSPDNQEYVKELVSGEISGEISKASLEVLSVVAYRGPVTRAAIEVLRGVNSTYSLRNLLLRGLVTRRETEDVRGYLYEISIDFLKELGKSRVQELPNWAELSANEKVSELFSQESEPPEGIESQENK